MRKIYPAKLQAGDEVRVIAPARSLALISDEVKTIAEQRFSELKLRLTFGKHVMESDAFHSSSVQSRIEDLHDAFADKNVKGIISVIGGFNSNQLLDYIDWNLIKKNPKIFCGYSDMTILQNAMFTKTGLVTYYGPHYSSFGMKLHFGYTLEYFKSCLLSEVPFEVYPSENWTDDLWFKDQEQRVVMPSDGWRVVNEGTARGMVVGGNLCTFNLLQGTPYMPSLQNAILFLEDDDFGGNLSTVEFDRNIQSLIQQKDFGQVKGVVIGRFQKNSQLSIDTLKKIIKNKKELLHLPIIADVDFGHTDPRFTFPIGGEVEMVAGAGSQKIKIIKH